MIESDVEDISTIAGDNIQSHPLEILTKIGHKT
jgi:hypothetical protein